MAYKSEPRGTTIADAVSTAFAELQSLRDEMRETADNMEAGGLGSTSKYQMASDAADALDSQADNEPGVPGFLDGIAVSYSEQVNKDKRRGSSRAVRLGNAVNMLQGVVDALETEIDLLDNVAHDSDSTARDAEVEAESLRQEGNDVDADLATSEMEAAHDAATQAESDKDEAESLKDEIEMVISEVEGVEFPGMFG